MHSRHCYVLHRATRSLQALSGLYVSITVPHSLFTSGSSTSPGYSARYRHFFDADARIFDLFSGVLTGWGKPSTQAAWLELAACISRNGCGLSAEVAAPS